MKTRNLITLAMAMLMITGMTSGALAGMPV